jgi:tetratricopeptide (TPR) repeat protein
MSSGIGHGEFPTWIAPVASFEIGNEQVKNTSLRVGDIKLEDVDMLIGADFFLSHRIFVAKSQSRLYFTYNGGPVFNLEHIGDAVTAVQQASANPPNAPIDADGLSRRAAAFAARGQYDSAITDYTHAIAMAPVDPQLLIDRGDVYWRNGQPDLAAADFTAALKLKPADDRALMERGELRLNRGDETGAAADFDAAVKANADEHFAIAQLYVSAARYSEAIGHFDAWIAAYPNGSQMADVLDNRCWARALSGDDLGKAEADCDAALRLDPRDPSILGSRGLVRLRRGNPDGAIDDYSASLRSTKKNPWSLYGRGVARLRKGLKADGDADIAAATGEDPGMAERFKKLGLTP